MTERQEKNPGRAEKKKEKAGKELKIACRFLLNFFLFIISTPPPG